MKVFNTQNSMKIKAAGPQIGHHRHIANICKKNLSVLIH